METGTKPLSARRLWLAAVLGAIAIAILLSLGTWQMQRLYWKEDLLATIDRRMHAEPLTLAEAERLFAETSDVDYVPITATGSFVHEGERHFLATWKGQSGFYVYTPLKLGDGRFLLARNPLSEKPSSMVPDNDLTKNIFYWKDRDVMAASAGLPDGYVLLPFFLDADSSSNPGDWPAGGVTIVSLPNNHLQYAVTWYGLAAALAGVMLFSFAGRRRRTKR
jgi:surfeit locus 1 family protein